ncbi:MAG TPA: hypothetical protein VGK17_02715 [Propionicimonas sp.]
MFDEVYRGFAQFADLGRVTVDQMRSCFERDYLPYIAWVSVAGADSPDKRVASVAQIDPSDAPTAHLASLIAPAMVFSGDRSLRKTGFAPPQWRDAANAMVQAGEQRETQDGVALAISLPALGLVNGAAGLSRRIGLPGWAGPAAIVGAVVWALTKKEHRELVARFMTPIAEAAVQFSEQQTATDATISAVLFMPGADRTLKQAIASVLARTAEPLLAREVTDRLGDEGQHLTVEQIRGVLRAEPEFVGVDYRWQLGRTLSGDRW